MVNIQKINYDEARKTGLFGLVLGYQALTGARLEQSRRLFDVYVKSMSAGVK